MPWTRGGGTPWVAAPATRPRRNCLIQMLESVEDITVIGVCVDPCRNYLMRCPSIAALPGWELGCKRLRKPIALEKAAWIGAAYAVARIYLPKTPSAKAARTNTAPSCCWRVRLVDCVSHSVDAGLRCWWHLYESCRVFVEKVRWALSRKEPYLKSDRHSPNQDRPPAKIWWGAWRVVRPGCIFPGGTLLISASMGNLLVVRCARFYAAGCLKPPIFAIN